MAKISLYERTIEAQAKKLSKQFPEHIRPYAQKTIEHLLEHGRDFALVTGKRVIGNSYVELDSTIYRTEFDRNSETVSKYCRIIAKADKPLSALQLLEDYEHSPLIELEALRHLIREGLPSELDELKKKLDLLKDERKRDIESIAARSEQIESIESRKKFDYGGVYKSTPYDSRPCHPSEDSD